MLKYTINKNNVSSHFRNLFNYGDTGITISADTTGITFSCNDENDNRMNFLKNNDIVRFLKKKCNDISFYEDKKISKIESGFTISKFSNIYLSIDNVTVEHIFPYYNLENPYSYLILTLDTPHYFIDNQVDDESACDINIKETVIDQYEYYDKSKKRCVGDYFLCCNSNENGGFLYQANGISADNRYYSDNYALNGVGSIIVKGEGIDSISGITGEGKIGEDYEYLGNNTLRLDNVIIPITSSGRNNRYKLIWKGNQNIIIFLNENYNRCLFYVEDERFIDESGITENTDILLNESFIKINTNISENFETNLFKEDILNDKMAELEEETNQNQIIDYEKQTFYPVYLDDSGNTYDLSSITFNLHFRQRNYTSTIVEETEIVDYGEWKFDDKKLWNNYPYLMDGSLQPDSGITSVNQSDLVGYLGFTDDDIYYQKKKVSKSFLRLSFYDNKDRKTQNLLGYSTLYLDSKELYKKYLNIVSNDNKDMRGYVFTQDEENWLGASFICGDKYNYSSSSEGFYLHLFPSLLDTQEIDENGFSIIYMKAEFNHAKYGYVIPFINPSGYTELSDHSLSEFPYHYWNDTEKRVDMQEYFSDNYIKVGIKYDSNNKHYIWTLLDKINDKNAIVNLFEPRINNNEANKKIPITLSYESTTGISYKGGTILITVNSENPWTAELISSDNINGSFITQSGGNGNKMEYLVGFNNDLSDKTLKFKFTNDSTETISQTYTQEENGSELRVTVVSPTSYEIPAEGGTIVLNIWVKTAKGSITVTGKTVNITGSNDYTLNIAANNSFDVKNINVEVYYDIETKQTFSFTQLGKEETLSLNPTYTTVSSKGTQVAYRSTITYNGAYSALTLSCDSTWLEKGTNYDFENSGKTLVVKEIPVNHEKLSRVANITVNGITNSTKFNIQQRGCSSLGDYSVTAICEDTPYYLSGKNVIFLNKNLNYTKLFIEVLINDSDIHDNQYSVTISVNKGTEYTPNLVMHSQPSFECTKWESEEIIWNKNIDKVTFYIYYDNRSQEYLKDNIIYISYYE